MSRPLLAENEQYPEPPGGGQPAPTQVPPQSVSLAHSFSPAPGTMRQLPDEISHAVCLGFTITLSAIVPPPVFAQVSPYVLDASIGPTVAGPPSTGFVPLQSPVAVQVARPVEVHLRRASSPVATEHGPADHAPSKDAHCRLRVPPPPPPGGGGTEPVFTVTCAVLVAPDPPVQIILNTLPFCVTGPLASVPLMLFAPLQSPDGLLPAVHPSAFNEVHWRFTPSPEGTVQGPADHAPTVPSSYLVLHASEALTHAEGSPSHPGGGVTVTVISPLRPPSVYPLAR